MVLVSARHHWHTKIKAAADAYFTLDADLYAVPCQDNADERKADPCAPIPTRVRSIDLVKGIEDLINLC